MSDTGGRKDDRGKVRVDLVPPEGIDAAARAFGFGAGKYEPFNWAKGMAWLRLYGATLRHLLAWVGREEADSESGLSHLDHALASLMMLRAHVARQLGTDDRPLYAHPDPDALRAAEAANSAALLKTLDYLK